MSDVGCFHLVSGGPLAAHRLAAGGRGCVAAVFARSFYVALESDLIAIGSRDFPMGPLNVASSAPARIDWPGSGLQVGMAAALRSGCLEVTDGPSFDGSSLRLWRPPALGTRASPGAVQTAIRCFDALAARLAPEEGFGGLFHVSPPPGLAGAAARRARPQITLFEACLRAGKPLVGPSRAAVGRLLGLGPGLTPSGDDCLAGMMIALHGLGQRGQRDELAALVRELAPSRTTTISRAHLKAAADGMGSQVLHALLGALLTGDGNAVAAALPALDGLGHTSGWDAAAGLLSVVRSHAGVVADQPASDRLAGASDSKATRLRPLRLAE